MRSINNDRHFRIGRGAGTRTLDPLIKSVPVPPLDTPRSFRGKCLSARETHRMRKTVGIFRRCVPHAFPTFPSFWTCNVLNRVILCQIERMLCARSS